MGRLRDRMCQSRPEGSSSRFAGMFRGEISLGCRLGGGQATLGFVKVERLRDRMCQSPPESSSSHFAERTAPRGGAARYGERFRPTSSLAGSLKNQVAGLVLVGPLGSRNVQGRKFAGGSAWRGTGNTRVCQGGEITGSHVLISRRRHSCRRSYSAVRRTVELDGSERTIYEKTLTPPSVF